jgi:hypothetical protein
MCRASHSTLPQAAPQGKTALVWRENAMVKGRKDVPGGFACGGSLRAGIGMTFKKATAKSKAPS